MSLEQALADNTAAMKELAEMWRKLMGAATHMQELIAKGETTTIRAAGIPVAEVAAPKTEKAQPAPTPAAPVTAPTEPAPAEPASACPSEEPKVTIKELTEATTEAATRNREGLVSLLKSYNVSRAGALDKALWSEYVAKVRAL